MIASICQKVMVQCHMLQKFNFVGLIMRFSYFLNQSINTNVNVNIKEQIGKAFTLSMKKYKKYLIATPQSGFIAPHVWEVVGRKNLTISKGCHYSLFYIRISLSFWEIETKNLNSNPGILISIVLGTTSPAAH